MTNTDTPGEGLAPKALEAICRTLAGLVRDRDVERVAGAIVDDLRDEGFAISVIGSDTAGLPSDHAGLVDQMMEALFGKYDEKQNYHAWIDPNWEAAKSKVAEAIAALSRAPEAVGVVEQNGGIRWFNPPIPLGTKLYATPPAPQPPVNGDVVAAAKPFANYPVPRFAEDTNNIPCSFTAGEFRRLRAALSASPPQGGQT